MPLEQQPAWSHNVSNNPVTGATSPGYNGTNAAQGKGNGVFENIGAGRPLVLKGIIESNRFIPVDDESSHLTLQVQAY